DREIIAQGVANFASAALGGMAGSGTSGPTFVCLESGAMTRMAGIMEGAFALAAVLLMKSLIAWIPVAALAGILFIVGYRMLDRASFGLARHRGTLLDFVEIGRAH